MGNYSEEEIKAFELKDKRINRVAILKSLFESGKVGVDEVLQNCQLAEQYVDYIYNGLPCEKDNKPIEKPKQCEIDWSKEAKLSGIPAPTVQNIKILTAIMAEFKKINDGVEICPNNLLNQVYKKYSKYPTSMSSVETVLKILN